MKQKGIRLRYWIRKKPHKRAGEKVYPLANCQECGKRSNTTDKETARLSFKFGYVCRDCKRKLRKEGYLKDKKKKGKRRKRK